MSVAAAGRILGAGALLLIVLCPAAARAGGDGVVRGTLSSRGAGIEGAAVEVYLEGRRSAAGTPFAAAESGAGGAFSVTLPPGDYYLWARGSAPLFGPPLVTEYPGNPVTVHAGRETLLDPFELTEAGRAVRVPPETGIRGRVQIGGEPAPEASVMAYDGEAPHLMGPSYAGTVLTGADGLFEIGLAPGRYRLAARKRRGGEMTGLLQEGDYSVEYEGNPVTVRRGEYTDVGVLAMHRVEPERLAERQAPRAEDDGTPTVRGRVLGPDGKGLSNQYVFVYRDSGMIGRPDQVAVSGEDGAFSIGLPGAGLYYLGARSSRGGPRQPGEMVGRVSGSPDSSVDVRRDVPRDDVLIRMEMVW